MSIALSKMAITAVIVGVGSAVTALGGHETVEAPPAPVVQQATAGRSDMCAIAASFSGNPVMAEEIRRAANCGKATASR
jgi:hypothetical protein